MAEFYRFEDIKNEFLIQNRDLVKKFSKDQTIAYITVLDALTNHIESNALYLEKLLLVLPEHKKNTQVPKKKSISQVEELDDSMEEEPQEELEEQVEETEEPADESEDDSDEEEAVEETTEDDDFDSILDEEE